MEISHRKKLFVVPDGHGVDSFCIFFITLVISSIEKSLLASSMSSWDGMYAGCWMLSSIIFWLIGWDSSLFGSATEAARCALNFSLICSSCVIT